MALPVPESEYRRAPFFGDTDAFMVSIESYTATDIEPAPEPSFSVFPDIDPNEGVLANPTSILRLRIDRGDFAYSNLSFESYTSGPTDWNDWTGYILSKPAYVTLLTRCGLIRAVRLFEDFRLARNNGALISLISRWNADSHTFLTSWGEFSISVEDICQLTGLEPLGTYDTMSIDRPEERDIIDFLQSCYTRAAKYEGLTGRSPSKTTFSQWQRFCFHDAQARGDGVSILNGPVLEHKYHLATYILAFLSRFLLPGRVSDSPRRTLFKLASVLCLGRRPPLAQLVLGTLYFRLDEVYDNFCQSAGQFDVSTYVPTILLMGFLFERFPQFAPVPFIYEPLPEGETGSPWLSRWASSETKESLEEYIDNEQAFCFRPYRLNTSCYTYPFFRAIPFSYVHPQTLEDDWESRSNGVTLILLFPSRLPWIGEDEQRGTAGYNPQRFLRQFGYDQVAPGSGMEITVSEEGILAASWAYPTREGAFEMGRTRNQFRFPSASRLAKPTMNWYLFWFRQCSSCLNFVRSNPMLERGGAKNSSLKKCSGKGPDWRGPYSTFERPGIRVVRTYLAPDHPVTRPAPARASQPKKVQATKRKVSSRREEAERDTSTFVDPADEPRRSKRLRQTGASLSAPLEVVPLATIPAPEEESEDSSGSSGNLVHRSSFRSGRTEDVSSSSRPGNIFYFETVIFVLESLLVLY